MAHLLPIWLSCCVVWTVGLMLFTWRVWRGLQEEIEMGAGVEIMSEQWVYWDAEPEAFSMADGRMVVGRPGDWILMVWYEDGTRAVVDIEQKPLH